MTMETIFKAYVYKNMLKDLAKFVSKNLKKIDLDRDDLLRRVGLSTYTPVKSTVAGVSLLLIGAAAGVAVGLALAPKPGVQLRAEVKDKALDVLDSITNVKPELEQRPRA
jgi:hypothetical protein